MKTLNLKNTVLILVMTLGFSIQSFAQKTQIQINQLPEIAKTFINQNFKNENISYIVKEEEFLTVDEYKVVLGNGTKIEFDSKGNWKEVSNKTQALKTNFIPKNILSYCTKSFPNTFVTKIEKSRWKYEVELSNGLELLFDSEGNFTRIDD